MRVFISVDMEGISGLVRWPDVSTKGIDYARGRHFLTADDERDVGALGGHRAETLLERLAFRGSRRVALDRLVYRRRHTSVSVEASHGARGCFRRNALGADVVIPGLFAWRVSRG